MLNGNRFIGRDGWKPDVETRTNSGSALYRNGAVEFLNDFTNRREPETVAVWTRRKERLENPLQCRLVHTAPGIRDRYDHVATGADVNTPDPQCLSYLPHFNPKLDDARIVHRLCGIVADIQDNLLQLCRLRRYHRGFGGFGHRDRDIGR